MPIQILKETKREVKQQEPKFSVFYESHAKGPLVFYIPSHLIFKIIRQAEAAGKNEIMGLMFGDLLQWKEGDEVYQYAVIKDLATGSLDATDVSVKFKDLSDVAPVIDEVTRKWAKKNIDILLLGWYHSHPGHMCFFSGTDVSTHERMFKQPYQSGLVVDPLNFELNVFGVKDKRYYTRNYAITSKPPKEFKPKYPPNEPWITDFKIYHPLLSHKKALYEYSFMDSLFSKLEKKKIVDLLKMNQVQLIKYFKEYAEKFMEGLEKNSIRIPPLARMSNSERDLFEYVIRLSTLGNKRFCNNNILYFFALGFIYHFYSEYYALKKKEKHKQASKFAREVAKLNVPAPLEISQKWYDLSPFLDMENSKEVLDLIRYTRSALQAGNLDVNNKDIRANLEKIVNTAYAFTLPFLQYFTHIIVSICIEDMQLEEKESARAQALTVFKPATAKASA